MSVLANMTDQANSDHFANASTAQIVLARTARHDPSLLATLVQRSDLNDAAWAELWQLSKSPRQRLPLAQRPLSPACAELAITDRRPSVLAAVLHHNPSGELASRIPEKLIDGKLADEITRCAAAPFPLRLRAAAKASLPAQIAFALTQAGSGVDDDTIVGWLATADPRVTSETRSRVQILLFTRPQLIGRLLGMWAWLTQVIAGSIALPSQHVDAVLADATPDKYALFALVSNPVVDPSVVMSALSTSPFYTDVLRLAELRTGRPAVTFPLKDPTPETIAWLSRRCAVSESRPQGRPLEALALTAVALDKRHTTVLRDVFESASHWPAWTDTCARGLAALGETRHSAHVDESRTDPHPTTDLSPILAVHPRLVHGAALMQLAVSALGDDLAAWENFVALVEEFDGPLGQLFDVARALA